MSKTFIIKDTVPCWVTMEYHVEADDREHALEAFYESQADYIGQTVGETLSWVDHTSVEVEEYRP